MDTASIPSFFRTLLIIILGYYLFKFLARIFAPILIQKAANKVQQKMENEMRKQQQQYTNTQNEKSRVSTEKPKEKKKVGEYIDFEEIE
ncbi:DUF4834 family protein [Flavobacterium sp.]|uniref:DUF4834 family protein n=1 Tax=Flavobacterium sp. TaxID=239 RepID=UPI003527CC63